MKIKEKYKDLRTLKKLKLNMKDMISKSRK